MLSFLLFFACTGNSPKDSGQDLLALPTGPEPSFPVPSDGPVFLPIETVKAEFDNGASFYFLDARPVPDYQLRHITGAFSVPFYQVEDEASRFPKNAWYIAYCACPHSESGIVADYFWELGYKKVAILDEGYLVWEDLGYPTEGNAPIEEETATETGTATETATEPETTTETETGTDSEQQKAKVDIEIWATLEGSASHIQWQEVSLRPNGRKWSAGWEKLALNNPTSKLQANAAPVQIANGTVNQDTYLHVFADAATITTESGKPIEDIIEPIAAYFTADGSYRIDLQFIVLEKKGQQMIFTKDSKITRLP